MIKKGKEIVLSKRLQMLADLVTPGNRVVDVGCDHGFLSIYLVESGISPKALAMDVRTGPLAAAAEHIAERSLQDAIETRLSDGLREFLPGEADTCICAGMGGKLMAKILEDSLEKARNLRELILQPQSELAEFRAFLRENGFTVNREDAVFEDGKYYFVMRASYTGRKEPIPDEAEQLLLDEFGAELLTEKHPVLQQFLSFREGILLGIIENIEKEASQKSEERLSEVREELKLIHKAQARFA